VASNAYLLFIREEEEEEEAEEASHQLFTHATMHKFPLLFVSLLFSPPSSQ
jgi:hypothetical protein